jgi:transposase-like protein
MLVRGGGNAKAANRRLRNVLKAQSVAPRVVFTDKLVSYAAARESAM